MSVIAVRCLGTIDKMGVAGCKGMCYTKVKFVYFGEDVMRSVEDKRFYAMLTALTLPIVGQKLLDALVNTVDVLMLNYVSQAALSASSLANKVYFILSLFIFGISTGSSVLISQYWGKRDLHTVERVMGITLRVMLYVSACFSLAAWMAPDLLMRIFTNDAELISIGADYLRILAFSYLCTGFSSVYASCVRAIERVRFGLILTLVQLLLNVALNACLIFGLCGMPVLGVNGVALATSISRLVGVVLCVADNAKSSSAKIRVRLLFQRIGNLKQDLIRYTLPALCNDVVWGLGFSMFSVILGRLGSDAVAADSIAGTVRNLATVVCYALANAGSILLGKTMGENRLAEARAYAKRLLLITLALGIAGGILILCATPFIIEVVNMTDTATDYLWFMLCISAYYVLGQAINTLVVCGIFRAGGDTRFGFLMDCIVMWGYAVPIGIVGAFVLHLPVKTVYFLMLLDEFVKMPAVFKHYRGERWVQNITREM